MPEYHRKHCCVLCIKMNWIYGMLWRLDWQRCVLEFPPGGAKG